MSKNHDLWEAWILRIIFYRGVKSIWLIIINIYIILIEIEELCDIFTCYFDYLLY